MIAEKPSRGVRIHYAGELHFATKHILPGWAACVSGDQARRIRAAKRNTYDRSAVTCKRCLSLISQATEPRS